MYRACIFDLDGTLAYTLDSIAYFSNKALEKCGYRAIPVEDYKVIVGDGADMQVRRMLDSTAGKGAWTEEDFHRVREIYGNLYGSNPTYLLKNYSGMPQTLQRLKAAGIKAAVLSNKPDAWVAVIIESLFPAGTFDICCGQRQDIPRKPSPKGALLIAEKLGVSPAQCLYIGDTNTDMKTGASAGMDTAGAVWGYRGRDELIANHAKYLADVPEKVADIAMSGMQR
ncbi:MAG TPA: HAD family hydrolase [Ruminococcaceae bacterium]|nr:HAD family hydrolase [Oscillospiraceae bacterium]